MSNNKAIIGAVMGVGLLVPAVVAPVTASASEFITYEIGLTDKGGGVMEYQLLGTTDEPVTITLGIQHEDGDYSKVVLGQLNEGGKGLIDKSLYSNLRLGKYTITVTGTDTKGNSATNTFLTENTKESVDITKLEGLALSTEFKVNNLKHKDGILYYTIDSETDIEDKKELRLLYLIDGEVVTTDRVLFEGTTMQISTIIEDYDSKPENPDDERYSIVLFDLDNWEKASSLPVKGEYTDVEEPVVEDEDTDEPVVEDIEEPVVEDIEEPVVEDIDEIVVGDTDEPLVDDNDEPVIGDTPEVGEPTVVEPDGDVLVTEQPDTEVTSGEDLPQMNTTTTNTTLLGGLVAIMLSALGLRKRKEMEE